MLKRCILRNLYQFVIFSESDNPVERHRHPARHDLFEFRGTAGKRMDDAGQSWIILHHLKKSIKSLPHMKDYRESAFNRQLYLQSHRVLLFLCGGPGFVEIKAALPDGYDFPPA